MIFQCVASGGTAGGDSDLAIDRGQVCIDGAGLMTRRSETWVLLSPLATRRNTSTSRAVSPLG
jgi:hypothetical protein